MGVWLGAFAGEAEARALCSRSIGLEEGLKAGGVVVVGVGRACGRGGGWSGGWEGLVVAFLVGVCFAFGLVWFGCGLESLEVGRWRCCVVLC